MQMTFEMMQQCFANTKQSGSYFLLFLLSIFILYYLNKERNRGNLLFAAAGMLLVYANPLSVWILAKVFPILQNYEKFILLIPVLLYVPYAGVELMDRIKDARLRKMYMLFATILILLSGNLAGFSKPAFSQWKENRMSSEQKEITAYVASKGEIMALADESILPYIRQFAGDASLLYGSDMWTQGLDLGIMDGYSEELTALYESMKTPKDTIHDILQTAAIYDCDMIVVKNFKYHPAKEDGYALVKTSTNYLIYEKKELLQEEE